MEINQIYVMYMHGNIPNIETYNNYIKHYSISMLFYLFIYFSGDFRFLWVNFIHINIFQEGTFKDGILGLGEEYQDTCTDGNCMTMLSFYVCVLMIAKPVPKFIKDLILP